MLAYETERQQPPRGGLLLLQALIVLLFTVFALRFWYLQVHRGAEFATKASENRWRQEKVPASRGLIKDRLGRLLAINEPAYGLALIREDVHDLDATLHKVADWTGMPVQELQETVQQARRRVKRFERLVLVPDLSFGLLARIEAHLHRWPGLEIVIRPRRYYEFGHYMAHVLGYVAEASEDELAADQALDLGDRVGKQGLELVLEDSLRGSKGRAELEVDAVGRLLTHKVNLDPHAGSDAVLSLDLDLQRFAAQELERNGHAGAVVVLEPFTGQVLALASTPGYDNNAFASGLSQSEWAALRDDPRHPLQNKAIQGVYPPGSVFKLVMALAGLAEGVIDPEETVFCPGHMRLGSHVFRCWRKGGHGNVNLRQALVNSCDVYFYEMGQRLGVDRIAPFAKSSGFGRKTGIDLPHEKAGLIPTKEWKYKRFGERWQGGENLNMAIGQGYTLASPLQVARFVGSVVNGGYLLKPALLAGAKPTVTGRLPVTDSDLQMVRDAMVETVQTGTARRLKRDDAEMGGKTGTAQVVRLKKEDRGKATEEIPYEFRDHAWIASFGVFNGASVVIVSMVEHGGHGSESAIPVAKAVYDLLFERLEKAGPPLAAWPYVAGRDEPPLGEQPLAEPAAEPETAAKADAEAPTGGDS